MREAGDEDATLLPRQKCHQDVVRDSDVTNIREYVANVFCNDERNYTG